MPPSSAASIAADCKAIHHHPTTGRGRIQLSSPGHPSLPLPPPVVHCHPMSAHEQIWPPRGSPPLSSLDQARLPADSTSQPSVESPLTLKGPHVIYTHKNVEVLVLLVPLKITTETSPPSNSESPTQASRGLFYIVVLKMLLLPPCEEGKIYIIIVLLKSL